MFKLWGYDPAWCWSVFKTMLLVDFEQARGTFVGKLIDRFAWMMSSVLVAAYLWPVMGMTTEFGKIILAGVLASIGVIEAYSIIALIIADLEGDRAISYYLTLPIPPALVFIRMLVYNALFFTAVCLVLFPACNLFLPAPIAYSMVHWPKFIVTLLCTNFFHGALILWAATCVADMRMLGKVWSRLLHPLWFFGGFQFTWLAACKKSVWLGYLVLLNPLMHASEGMRSALIGGDGYLPFWVSTSVLVGATVLMMMHAIARFKRRLDVV